MSLVNYRFFPPLVFSPLLQLSTVFPDLFNMNEGLRQRAILSDVNKSNTSSTLVFIIVRVGYSWAHGEVLDRTPVGILN